MKILREKLSLHLGIAKTKKNLVDKDLLSLAEIEVRELIQGSPLEKATVVTVDSLSGEGIEDLRSTLLHQIEKTEHTSFEFRKTHQVSHLPIDRVFAIRGFGTVVTGTLHTRSSFLSIVIFVGSQPNSSLKK